MKANDEAQAVKAAQEALYKQLKMDKFIKRVKNKYVSKNVQKYSSWLIVTQDAVHKEEIKYVWTYNF